MNTMTDAINHLKALRTDILDEGLEDSIDWRAAVRAGQEGCESNRYEDIDGAAVERMLENVNEQIEAL